MMRKKYPRTAHLPGSGGVTFDDITRPLDSFTFTDGREVVITEKMDGENTTLTHDGIHARSTDSLYHPSRGWITAFYENNVRGALEPNQRVIVENVFARHSIAYNHLDSYAYVIGVIEDEVFLPWDDVEFYAEAIGLPTVPVLIRSEWSEKMMNTVIDSLDTETQEGIVVRPAGRFPESEFTENVGKWVRPGHVQTDTHWSTNWTRN